MPLTYLFMALALCQGFNLHWVWSVAAMICWVIDNIYEEYLNDDPPHTV